MSIDSKVLLQLKLDGTDDVIDIHKVSAIKHDIPTIFSIERMVDGKFRLTYNAIKIPDLTKIQGISFIRQS